MSEVLKILLVQTMNMNLGDSVLSDCDEYLLKRCLGKRKHLIFKYNIASRDTDQIRYVDAVIFAGGIFKVTNEKFWLYIPEILHEADRLQVPVFFSAIGVEAFYPDDERSVALKEALNLSCVKGISARDDIETLRRDYITNPDIRITSVCDPAVWCSDVYREALEDREMPVEKTVGVGIVRHKLFEDYGHPEVTREDQLRFWQGVIDELEVRGLPWKIFTNGDRYDELFAEEVLNAVGHGEKCWAPMDSEEMVQMIGEFSAVIAGRMHSNIVAYALGIPAVGFIWNQKLRFWGEKTGHPERFFETDKMDPAAMVDMLVKAMRHPIKPTFFQKRNVYKAMKRFVDQYCVVRQDREHEDLPIHASMVATALGGIDKRYRNTNSRTAFQYSLSHGYRNFELDLRLTSDEELVCVNRWHRDTYQMFNLPVDDEQENMPPLSLEEFREVCCYQRFPTMSFSEFDSLASPILNRPGYRLVISFGRPSGPDLAFMLEKLKVVLTNGRLDPKRLLLRIERRKDLAVVQEADLGAPVLYYIVPPKDAEEEARRKFIQSALEFCREQSIEFAAISVDYYDDAAELFQEAGVRPIAFTYVKCGRILKAIRSGAWAASHLYDPDYIDALIR